MDMNEFSRTNAARGVEWNPPESRSSDSLDRLMFAVARVAAEAGEAVGKVDKLVRKVRGWAGAPADEADSLRRQVAAEVADTIIFADLALAELGTDMAYELWRVFNTKSVEYGSGLRIGPQSAAEAFEAGWLRVGMYIATKHTVYRITKIDEKGVDTEYGSFLDTSRYDHDKLGNLEIWWS